MARVFSAVDIEDKEALEKLSELQERLNLGFSTVPPEKMHITLEFFEDVNEKEITQIKKALNNLEKNSFKASINGVGAFPSEDYIRVLWAGVKSPGLFELKKEVSTHEVTSQEQNSFTPHVTLLRVRDISPERKKKLRKPIKEYRKHQITEIQIDKVKLFESVMTGEGTKYRELDEKKL